ncbi:MAG: SDR family NAD(P)-dependent oxidoreductase [Kofleriaceae bacterium]
MRRVLVTGGSRGLGQAIAIAFAGDGAHVWVGHARNTKAAEATVETIRAAGGSAAPLAFDVTDSTAVEAAIAAAVAERGGIDVLVHAAGIARDSLFVLSEPDDWDEPIRVNLGGALRTTRAVVRPMLSAGKGTIVLVGSVAGGHASPGQAGYSASKGGLEALGRTLAAELAPRGIRVNVLVPGLCAAGMAQRLDRRILQDRVARIPVGRLGRADEIASVALFLASDAASYVVGQSIVVDGGLTL